MPYSTYTQLPGITQINDAVFDEQIVENLIAYFDWGFLSIGAFTNVARPSPKSKFHVASTPNYVPGTVWETSRGNWVWENTIPYGVQPTQIAGVYINGTLTTTGFFINYIDGQVIFEAPLASTTTVEVEFAYKRFSFFDGDADWFHQVIFDPLPLDSLTEILAKNRVYLPAIIIEVVAGASLVPLQLGDTSVIENQPVLLHILTDRFEDRDKLLYIFKRMFDKTLWFYDVNAVADANAFPLNEDGSLVDSPLMYPDLLNAFMWKKCRVVDVKPQDITPQLPLFRAVVRLELQTDLP